MESFGRYALIRHLATGGMAEVHLAKIAGLGGFEKLVVIKRLLTGLAKNSGFVDMFLDEARLAAALNHPNIVQIFDLGMESGQYFIAMEYLDGPSLFGLLEASRSAGNPIPLVDGIQVMTRVLDALAYAHAVKDGQGAPLKLVHRDVSPENILLSRTGAVKLADFGIARAANRIQITTQAGGFKGKLHYLAPEILREEPFDSRSDLFSAGVVLYQLLTGHKPFDGKNALAILEAIAHEEPPRLVQLRPEAPADLQAVIDQALAKNPRDRYPTASAMLAELTRAVRTIRVAGSGDLSALIASLFPDEAHASRATMVDGRARTYTPQHPRSGLDHGAAPPAPDAEAPTLSHSLPLTERVVLAAELPDLDDGSAEEPTERVAAPRPLLGGDSPVPSHPKRSR